MHDPHQININNPLPILQVNLARGSPKGDPRVIDQNVDGTVTRQNLSHDLANLLS